MVKLENIWSISHRWLELFCSGLPPLRIFCAYNFLCFCAANSGTNVVHWTEEPPKPRFVCGFSLNVLVVVFLTPSPSTLYRKVVAACPWLRSFINTGRISRELFPCLKERPFLSDPDALGQTPSLSHKASHLSCSGTDLTPTCPLFFCSAGLRQSVQPAGHPATRRHELQAAPRSLDVCKLSS